MSMHYETNQSITQGHSSFLYVWLYINMNKLWHVECNKLKWACIMRLTIAIPRGIVLSYICDCTFMYKLWHVECNELIPTTWTVPSLRYCIYHTMESIAYLKSQSVFPPTNHTSLKEIWSKIYTCSTLLWMFDCSTWRLKSCTLGASIVIGQHLFVIKICIAI